MVLVLFRLGLNADLLFFGRSPWGVMEFSDLTESSCAWVGVFVIICFYLKDPYSLCPLTGLFFSSSPNFSFSLPPPSLQLVSSFPLPSFSLDSTDVPLFPLLRTLLSLPYLPFPYSSFTHSSHLFISWSNEALT